MKINFARWRKNNKQSVRNLASLQMVSLLIFSMASAMLLPGKALAVADPDISGGANITGYAGESVPVSPATPIEVSSSTDPITVQVAVESGTLSMTTTTGLSFITAETGSFIKFSGTVSDINAALATLKYQSLNTGNFTISAQVVDADKYYNPTNGSYYQAVPGDINFSDALNAAEALTYKGSTGHLLSINSQQENDFISDRVLYTSWLAATDSVVEGDWRWVAGSESGDMFWTGGPKGSGGNAVGGLYNNWADGEPNNQGGIEDCALKYYDGESWNDTECDGTLPSYIAEFEGATLPPSVSLQATISSAPVNNINIGNCEELQNIAADPGSYWYNNLTLTADFSCDGYPSFTPLFNNPATPYHGTFNGNGHTISNLTIAGTNMVGLFAYAENANINNVDIAGTSSISGNECVGSIVGSAKNTYLENNSSNAAITILFEGSGYGGIVGCYETSASSASFALRGNNFSGSTIGADGVTYFGGVGGIAGQVETSGSSVANIDDNYYSGSIQSGYSAVGGVVGVMLAAGASQATISSNNITGSITGSSFNVGGVIGYLEAGSTSTAIINSNTFAETAAIRDGYAAAGGIVGNYYAYNNGIIKVNYNSVQGIVGGASDGGHNPNYYNGGVVGYIDCESTYSEVPSCEVIENINDSQIATNNAYSGGIVGYIYNTSNLLIDDNINNGQIISDENSGGIVGYLYNEYYDSDLNVKATVQNNINNGLVTADSKASGVVGSLYVYQESDNVDIITNILNNASNGSIQANTENAGGVVGYSEAYSYYDTSTIQINIKDNNLAGDVFALSYAGGILGYVENQDGDESNALTMNIDTNYVTGDITTDGDSSAGLIGYAYNYCSNFNVTNNVVDTDVFHGDESYSSGLIAHLFNDYETQAEISGNSVSGVLYGLSYAGGIIGSLQNFSNSNTTVENNTNLMQVYGDGVAGGIVGILDNQDSTTTIHQNLNEGNVETTYGNTAGVVANVNNAGNYLDTEVNITQNINRGAISAQTDNAGGIVSYLYSLTNDNLATSNIHDNYNNGSIHAYSNAGGIMGYVEVSNSGNDGSYTTLDMARNYSSSSVGVDNIFAAGIIGEAVVSSGNTHSVINIENSFATGGPITAGEGGAAIVDYIDLASGAADPNITGTYFDQDALGQSSCTNYPSYTCNAVNTDGTQPDYFKNNTVNPPLNTWNFTNTWGTQSTINLGLPCLQWENPVCNPAGDADSDGITNAVENAGPNDGDANNDGILDYIQPRVTSLVDSVSGSYTLVQSSCGPNSEVSNSAESSSKRDSAYNYPAGLTSFTTTCGVDGATAKISYYIYGSFDPFKTTIRKYNPSTGAYTAVTDAQIGNTTIGGQAVLKAEYFVTDGGEFDLDGVANGIIVDPVGAATAATIAPNTGFGRN